MTETGKHIGDPAAERYSRQTMLAEIGPEGQQRLLDSAVLIVGLGGLGGAVATYLTGAGVGTLGLCDNDTVALSNLQRQVLYTEQEVGRPKTDCARGRLQSQSAGTEFRLYPRGLTQENAVEIVADYDLVIDCTDNFETRYLIDDVCRQAGKPWVYGSLGEFRGQVAVMNYRKGRHYCDLYPQRYELCSRKPVVTGVLGAVAGVIGSMQAAEAVKLLCGFGQLLDGRLFTIDLTTFDTRIFDF